MKLFIRPVYKVNRNNSEQLISLAVCSTNGELLVDEQIKEHFHPSTSGKEIKEEYPEADWGNTIQVKV